MSTATAQNIGHITQVIGSTFDVEFAEDQLPPIFNAVKIKSENKGVKINLTGEVQQHLGGGRVRCMALGATDGLIRGQECMDTGGPVKVPVGKRRSAACSTSPAMRSTAVVPSMPKSIGRSIATLRRWPSFRPRPSCSRPASRSSTCSRRSSAAARPACSAAPVWARRLFSPS